MSQLNLCMDIELVLLIILFGMFEVVIFPVTLHDGVKLHLSRDLTQTPFKYDLSKKTPVKVRLMSSFYGAVQILSGFF